MYIVKITNGSITTPIHNEKYKLKSGNVVKGINTIDSFSFTLLPDNPGFDLINDFTTLVSVYNTNKKRYDFFGRVLYSNSTMDSNGLITKEVTCESYFGFLCDSQQPYVDTTNWTVKGLLQHIIDRHNEQVEEYKCFKIGLVTVTDPNDNLHIGIQRENTWQTVQNKLIGQLGGEIRFRVESDGLYIDYLNEIGVHRATEIKMSKNMKSITKEVDPSSFISRLIPLGCKLKKEVDGETVETEERLDISSVNDGKNYIDVENGVDVYGIHAGYAYWDDVTEPSILLTKARNYLAENNRVLVKYSISAIDLSLLGLDIDDFDVHNYHPIINPLLGIDDTARITKKNIDVCNDVQSNIEIGDNFKTLSEIQQDQFNSLKNTIDKIKFDTSDFQGKVSVIQDSVNKLNTKIEGIDGTYLYIMYSPYEDGHEMTNTPDENTMYMGTCSTSEEEAPTDYKLYTWVKVRGIDGKSVSSVENYYMVTDKNSGVTNTDITQWKLNTIDKLTEDKPYLWNFERTIYSDDSFTDSEPALIGNYAKDGENGVGIQSIEEWYGLSNDENTYPASWSKDLPTMTPDMRFLWNYEVIKYTKGDPVTTEPLLIGVYGQKGENGRGIETVTNYYLASASSSGVTTSTTGWKDTIQSVSKTLPYLWTYEKITYTSGTPKTENTTPVIIAKYTENGSGISKITDYYAINNDPDTEPSDGSFSTALQKPTADNRYLWNYELIEYTEGKTSTKSAKRIIGVYGEKGEKGDTGVSIDTVTEYYARSSSSTSAPGDSSFGTGVPTLTATYKYLWNYEVITYTGGKTATKTPKSVIGVFGVDGKGISSITEYYLATSSSSGVTTSTSGWSTTPQATTTSAKYLWNYEKITYTDDTTHTTSPIIIGVHGATGASATAYSMILSANVIAKSSTGSYTPSSITLSGKSKTGTSSPVDYSCYFKVETTTDMSNWVESYKSTSNVLSHTYSVPSGIKALRCSMYLAGGTSTLLDQQIVPIVSDGTNGNHGDDAYTVILSNESHTFAGSTSAAIASTINVYVEAYKGTSQIETKITKVGSTSVTGTQTVYPYTGLSFTTYNNGGTSTSNYVQISATTSLTTKSGVVTLTIQADGKTFTKDFSFGVAMKGADGAGVSNVTNYYLATSSSSGITTSTSGWSTDVSTQTLTATNKYLWNYEQITYTGGKATTTTTPCIIGVFGKDGVSISSVTEYYARSTSSTSAPGDSSFGTSVPALDATYKYLWNYEKIEYTGGKAATTTPKCVIGVFGADGKTQYWHIKYSDDGGTTFTANNGETLGAWIGTYVDFNEADSTDPTKYTWKKFTEDVDEELEDIRNIVNEQYTSITRDTESIILEALTRYTETSNFEEFQETVNAQLQLLSDQLSLKFEETTKEITNINGELQSQINTITKHFNFTIDGMTIGQSDSPFKVLIDNDEYNMTYRDNKIFFVKNGEVYTPEITVDKKMTLLGYQISDDGTGIVNCEYVGG